MDAFAEYLEKVHWASPPEHFLDAVHTVQDTGEVGSAQPGTPALVPQSQVGSSFLDRDFDALELGEVLAKLQNHRATGVDKLEAELLKYMDDGKMNARILS